MSKPLAGKVAIVTGANTGIGRVTARELALQGAHVFLACRSEEKTRPVLEEIHMLSQGQAKAEYLPLDLGDLDAVRACASHFLERGLPLNILVANAGLAGQKGMTASGFELAFGTCHVGHFLLVNLLLERMKASAPARIVVVSSKAHRHAKGIDFEAIRHPAVSPGALHEYAVAKLANLLFAVELSRRLQGSGVTTYAVHPGIVASDVWRSAPKPVRALLRRFMISTEEGAATSLYCATSPLVATQSGQYYDKCSIAGPSPLAFDAMLARQLWDASERWTQNP
uniref:Transcriptional regulator, TetR family protein n=1 Tax=uncultured bacterium UPO53 TaxID=1776978 RepID=A0A126SYG1_9BACT|nr:transcriptional regulator, TetR family protein [uncultured bacterium UPO53]